MDHRQLDITDERRVKECITVAAPDAVIHCAAYTAVDAAESNEGFCRMVNADGTKNIAKLCGATETKMIYLSTDYVFNGQEGVRPWEPDDRCEPLNVYGQTKYEGELAVENYLNKFFIVRVSWVFGAGGKNFVKTMLKNGKEGKQLRVVDDQIGSPTYTRDLARLLVDMAESEKYGKYHATNEGFCSWYRFALEIFGQTGVSADVIPVSSVESPTQAKRPANSRMSKEKLDRAGYQRLPSWQDALSRYLRETGEWHG